ncbi:MAG: 4Fe-4S binding protein [Spirochaetia bacterium]|jgi:MinD superfamily P-loop ATPase|nr:4Fe-4S binding protein [Spirochaetia bacterium]
MTTVSVASGKGGAGKTSIAAALADTLGSACVFADCDVDAANGAIALGASIVTREPYFAGPGFIIEESACSGCGACVAACRFNAIEPVPGAATFRIVQELCERCGACMIQCPTKAITTFQKLAGELYVSDTSMGIRLVHAELEPGEDTSGKLVAKVRKRAEQEAKADSILVVDAPPGIGCPVIASITGCDLLVIVIEASASGIRDAARLIELAISMKRRCLGLINKAGLNVIMDKRAKAMLADAGIPLAGQIPFDTALRSIEESNRTWASLDAQSSDSTSIAEIQATLAAIKNALDTL